eukprot:4455446-Amphidinium_carterae.1
MDAFYSALSYNVTTSTKPAAHTITHSGHASRRRCLSPEDHLHSSFIYSQPFCCHFTNREMVLGMTLTCHQRTRFLATLCKQSGCNGILVLDICVKERLLGRRDLCAVNVRIMPDRCAHAILERLSQILLASAPPPTLRKTQLSTVEIKISTSNFPSREFKKDYNYNFPIARNQIN